MTLIPDGPRKPYRSTAKNDHRYYMRFVSNTEIIPHDWVSQ